MASSSLPPPPTDRVPLPPDVSVSGVDPDEAAEAEMSSAPLKRGFLTKQGQHWKNWRRRLFILKPDGFLRYYNVKDRAKLGGTLDMRQCTALLPGGKCAQVKWFSGANRSCCFALCTTKRTLFMFADNEEDMRGWLAAFREVCPAGIPMCSFEDIRASWTGSTALGQHASTSSAATGGRVSVFRNASSDQGKVIPLASSMSALRRAASEALQMPLPTRIFLANGAEIASIALVRDDDMLYCSAGEDFYLGSTVFLQAQAGEVGDDDDDDDDDDIKDDPHYADPTAVLAAAAAAAAKPRPPKQTHPVVEPDYEEPPQREEYGEVPPALPPNHPSQQLDDGGIYKEPDAVVRRDDAPPPAAATTLAEDYQEPPGRIALSLPAKSKAAATSDYQEPPDAPATAATVPKYSVVQKQSSRTESEDTYMSLTGPADPPSTTPVGTYVAVGTRGAQHFDSVATTPGETDANSSVDDGDSLL